MPRRREAFSALLFLCRRVLNVDLKDLGTTLRARRGSRLPVVLTPEEVGRVLTHRTGVAGLMLRLIYGSGLRLMECVRLRVKDADFGSDLLFVRDGKGGKDRATLLPCSLQGLSLYCDRGDAVAPHGSRFVLERPRPRGHIS